MPRHLWHTRLQHSFIHATHFYPNAEIDSLLNFSLFDLRDYVENLKGVSWGWFHKKTCRHKCFWPRYSVAVWMASGSTCADTIGFDEVKASTNIVVADVCAASVRKNFFTGLGSYYKLGLIQF